MFAESISEPMPMWATLIIQGGALFILGYHLLYGLPRMWKDIGDTHERIIDKLNESFDRRENKVTEATKEQTKTLGEKLDLFRDAACKFHKGA